MSSYIINICNFNNTQAKNFHSSITTVDNSNNKVSIVSILIIVCNLWEVIEYRNDIGDMSIGYTNEK